MFNQIKMYADLLTLRFACCVFPRCIALAFLVCLAPAHAKRVALIIGNAQYQNEKPLKNPVNDAHALARTLKEDLQFDDVIERSNVTRRELGRLIDQLGQRAQGADAVVVYYSGHGMQGAGGNYLIPVDAQITSTEDVKLEGVPANDVVEVLNQSGARVALLILDACRDNPFRTRTKGGSKGLARMNVSGGNLLVAYATQEGDTADDGSGSNSPYAQALIQNLKRKDLRVLEVFDEVAQQVKASTAQKQRPTRYGDLPVNVFLTGAPTQLASLQPVPVRPGTAGPTGGSANFGDLEQAQKEEAASRQQWAAWLARMKADFKKAQGFKGNVQYEAQAWDRFLSAYSEDDPYSNEDEALRAQAEQSRSAAQRQAAPVPPLAPAPAQATTFSSNSAPTGGTIKVGILHSLSGTMATEEAALKDVVLMSIDEINARGGVLGKKLEPVIVDPASNWPLFAQKAKQLLTQDKVAVIFGCWTSVSRKAILPVLRENNGLLFYPVPSEGEELDNNVFYTGAVPNQQAIPAADFLLSKYGGSARRFVLIGTDYVYSRTNYKILRAYLKSKGVSDADIVEQYTPFGHSDYQSIVADIRRFASAGQKTAVISSLYADSNVPFYREMSQQSLRPQDVPVMALTWGGETMRGVDTRSMTGQLFVGNYFMSLKNPSNEQFVATWSAYARDKNIPMHNTQPLVTDEMEATYVGVNMWAQAVKKAGTTDVNQVREAMAGQTFKAPDGYMVTMDYKNHHLQKPVFVSELKPDGQFRVIWKTMGPLAAEARSPYLLH